MAAPILATKLQIPPLRRNLVARPRLIDGLDRGLHRKLTLIAAPAGFGKTTLLCEWVQSLKARNAPAVDVAWLSLDEGDNDPARFAAYLAAAIQAGDEAFEPAGTLLQQAHLIRLINHVAALPRTLLLILDDYHLITLQEIHDALAFVVDHQPGNLHLALATRADPPLPLPRLRARGHLTELRQSDLRFTIEEAAAFLHQVTRLDLSPQDVAALEARTEGWIAGLQMASLAMQAAPALPGEEQDPTAFIRAFTGSHRFVLDYLTEEVLQRQPEEVQHFLLCTSILDRMCAPLCDALSPNLPLPHSSTLLAHLDHANLFVIPLDQERRWYRYHRLFADLLRRRLLQTAPEMAPVLHRRASLWYEQAGLTIDAIEHALAASDFDRAADLVAATAEATFMRSEVVTFLHWIERLPDREVRARPTLSFFHAWALLMSGRSADDVERRLQDLAGIEDPSQPPGTMAGRVAALRAYLLVFQLDLQQAVELCRQALEHLPESDQFLRSVVAWILSLAHLANGSLQDGKESLDDLVRKGQQVGNRLITVTALCQKARLQTRQGRLPQAHETYQQALQAATDSAGRRLPIASEALIGLGDLACEWNHLDTAADHLMEGIRLANQWSEMASFDAYTPLARVRLALGDVQGARDAIEAARQIAHRSQATRVDDLVVELQQAYFCIAQGDLAGAMSWAQRRGLLAGLAPEPQPRLDAEQDLADAHLRKYEQLVLTRLLLARGQAAQALDVLDSLLAQARRLERVDLLIEIHVLAALAHESAGRHDRALDALKEALLLAEPGGHIRTFHEARHLIYDLRLTIDDGKRELDTGERARLLCYADRLLATFPDAPPPGAASEQSPIPDLQPPADPLSNREIEVLRLLATGMSNPEIAAHLFIEVSTVRSHCKSIYAKLDVHNRWDAAHRAHELGLI
ncbi:MAG: tetratricopeptide repeat protein [Anaerolineae bacterium]|nr:tetratricopeptide repeat protein [Anaerolineae bacterium]